MTKDYPTLEETIKVQARLQQTAPSITAKCSLSLAAHQQTFLGKAYRVWLSIVATGSGSGDVHSNFVELALRPVVKVATLNPSVIHFTPTRAGGEPQVQDFVFFPEEANLLEEASLIDRTPGEIWIKIGDMNQEPARGQLAQTGGWLLADQQLSLESKEQWGENLPVFYSFSGQDYYELETALVVLPSVQIDLATLLTATTPLTALGQQQLEPKEELRVVARNLDPRVSYFASVGEQTSRCSIVKDVEDLRTALLCYFSEAVSGSEFSLISNGGHYRQTGVFSVLRDKQTIVQTSSTANDQAATVTGLRIGSSSFLELDKATTLRFNVTGSVVPLFFRSDSDLSHRDCVITTTGVYKRSPLVAAGDDWLCFFHPSGENPFSLVIEGKEETISIPALLYPTDLVSSASLELSANSQVLASTTVLPPEITSASEAAAKGLLTCNFTWSDNSWQATPVSSELQCPYPPSELECQKATLVQSPTSTVLCPPLLKATASPLLLPYYKEVNTTVSISWEGATPEGSLSCLVAYDGGLKELYPFSSSECPVRVSNAQPVSRIALAADFSIFAEVEVLPQILFQLPASEAMEPDLRLLPHGSPNSLPFRLRNLEALKQYSGLVVAQAPGTEILIPFDSVVRSPDYRFALKDFRVLDPSVRAVDISLFLDLRNTTIVREPIPLGSFSFAVKGWLPPVSSLSRKSLIMQASRTELQLNLEASLDEITLEALWLSSPHWPASKVTVEGQTVRATFLESNMPWDRNSTEPWTVSCTVSWSAAERTSLSLGLEVYVIQAPTISNVRFLTVVNSTTVLVADFNSSTAPLLDTIHLETGNVSSDCSVSSHRLLKCPLTSGMTATGQVFLGKQWFANVTIPVLRVFPQSLTTDDIRVLSQEAAFTLKAAIESNVHDLTLSEERARLETLLKTETQLLWKFRGLEHWLAPSFSVDALGELTITYTLPPAVLFDAHRLSRNEPALIQSYQVALLGSQSLVLTGNGEPWSRSFLLWNSIVITDLSLSEGRVLMATNREVHLLSLRVKLEGQAQVSLLEAVSRGNEVSFAFSPDHLVETNILKVSLLLYDQEISEPAYFSVIQDETWTPVNRSSLTTCPSQTTASAFSTYLLLDSVEGTESAAVAASTSQWQTKYEAVYQFSSIANPLEPADLSSSSPPEAASETNPIRTFEFPNQTSAAEPTLANRTFEPEVTLGSLLSFLNQTGAKAAWFERSDGISELVLSTQADPWFDRGAVVPNQTGSVRIYEMTASGMLYPLGNTSFVRQINYSSETMVVETPEQLSPSSCCKEEAGEAIAPVGQSLVVPSALEAWEARDNMTKLQSEEPHMYPSKVVFQRAEVLPRTTWEYPTYAYYCSVYAVVFDSVTDEISLADEQQEILCSELDLGTIQPQNFTTKTLALVLYSREKQVKQPTPAVEDPEVTAALTLDVMQAHLARQASPAEATPTSSEPEYPSEYPLFLHHWTSAPHFEVTAGITNSSASSSSTALFNFSNPTNFTLDEPSYADLNSSLLEEALVARKQNQSAIQLSSFSSLSFEAELHYTREKIQLILRAKSSDQNSIYDFVVASITTGEEAGEKTLALNVWAETKEWPRVRLSNCLLLPPTPSQASIVCTSTRKGVRRGENYAIILEKESESLYTTATFQLPLHSAETLSFSVSPGAVVFQETPTRFVLHLQNSNWAANTPAGLASQGARIASFLDSCIFDEDSTTPIEPIVQESDDDRILFECYFASLPVTTSTTSTLQVRDKNDEIVFATSIDTAAPSQVTSFSPEYVVNSTLETGESQRIRISAGSSNFFQSPFEAKALLMGTYFKVESDSEGPYFDFTLVEAKQASLHYVQHTVSENAFTESSPVTLRIEHPSMDSIDISAGTLAVYKSDHPDLQELSQYLLITDSPREISVSAHYFIPNLASTVELQLNRIQPTDGSLAKLNSTWNDSHSKLAFSGIIKNRTTASFSLPRGLTSGVYEVTLKQGSFYSRKVLPLVVIQRMITEPFITHTDPSTLQVPDFFEGRLNVTTRALTSTDPFQLPLFDEVSSLVGGVHNITVGCSLVLGSAECEGEGSQVAVTNYSCSLSLPDCPFFERQMHAAEEEARLTFFALTNLTSQVKRSAPFIQSAALTVTRSIKLVNQYYDRPFYLLAGRTGGSEIDFGSDLLYAIEDKSFCRVGEQEATLSASACSFTEAQIEEISSGVPLEVTNTAGQNWVVVKQPVKVIDSPFFHEDAEITSLDPQAFLGTWDQIVTIQVESTRSKISSPLFDNFRSVPLTCTLVHSRNSYSTSCGFTSNSLKEIKMRIPPNTLPPGSYTFAVSLNGTNVGPTLSGDPLLVLALPKLTSIFPRYLEPKSEPVYLIGQNFGGLSSLQGTLFCVFVLRDSSARVLKTVLAEERALQKTDRVIRCPPVDLSTFAPFAQESATKIEVKLAFSAAASRLIDLPVEDPSQDDAYFILTQSLVPVGTTPEHFSKYTSQELAGTSSRSISIQVRPSRALAGGASQVTVAIACEFSLDESFPSDSVSSSSGTFSEDEVSCQVPLMELSKEVVNVRLRLTQTPPSDALALITAALSQAPESSHTSRVPWPLKVLPIPKIAAVSPTTIYNLASVTALTVRGKDFVRTEEELLCFFFGSTGKELWRTKATFLSSYQVSCPFVVPPVRASSVDLKVSNDGGKVYSEESTTIALSVSLPRITGLANPRVLFASQAVDLSFSGVSLGAMGTVVTLQFSQGSETVSQNCTVLTAQTSMACYDVVFPSCGSNDNCTIDITVKPWAEDSALGGVVRQPISLTIHELPEFTGLNPSEGDATQETVQLLFSRISTLQGLAAADSADSCCVDPASTAGCSVACRLICKVYKPGQNLALTTPLAFDSDGQAQCELPLLSAAVTCNPEIEFLEIELLVDSYLTLPTTAKRFGCLMTTQVTAQANAPLVVYHAPGEVKPQRQASISGKNFNYISTAKCSFYDSSNNLALETEVDYQPELDPDRVVCSLTTNKIKDLRAGTTYNLRYSQRGQTLGSDYQVLFLRKPRILTVQSKLLDQQETVTITGLDFNSQVTYLCQYVERTASEVSSASDPPFSFFAEAAYLSSTQIRCPPLKEVPASSHGFKCLEVRVIDQDNGVSFRAEPGSPAEFNARPCLITDIAELIQPGDLFPPKVPLGPSAEAGALSDSARTLTLAFTPSSPIRELLAYLNAPLASGKLILENVITSGSQFELRADVQSLSSPSLVEISCTINEEDMICSPWPYIDTVVGDISKTGLTFVLVTSLNTDGRVLYPLDQSLEVFKNPTVSSWEPTGSLLQTVDTVITIEGSNFVDDNNLRCLWFQNSQKYGSLRLADIPSKFISTSKVTCGLPAELFDQTSESLTLHLSLDDGRTFEHVADSAPSSSLEFTLQRAPQVTGLQAQFYPGTTTASSVTVTQFVGRTPVLTLILTGTHFTSATAREPKCSFFLGGGRIGETVATIVSDSKITCLSPTISATSELGQQILNRAVKVSLTLRAETSIFDFVPQPSYSGKLGSRTYDHIVYIRYPSVSDLKVSHSLQDDHGDLASADRTALSAAPTTEMQIQLTVSTPLYLELAQSEGHDLKMVLVTKSGTEHSLVLDIVAAEDNRLVTSSTTAQTFTSSLALNGEYLVGLAPQLEISNAATKRELVGADSQTLLLVNSDGLKITDLFTSKLPLAPNLRTYVTVSVEATDLGIDLNKALPLLQCALVSSVTGDSEYYEPLYSESTLSLTTWSSTPSTLKIKFVFPPPPSRREGKYCFRVVLNGQLSSKTCESSDPTVELFHLPPSIFSAAPRSCDVSSELAEYPDLKRNFADSVAVVNGEIQYNFEDGSLLCDFDQRYYDFFHLLYQLNVGSPSTKWSLQEALATAVNQTDKALSASPEVIFRAHVKEVADPWAAQAQNQLPGGGTFHPGEDLTLVGYFLNNSALGSQVRLTYVDDPVIELFSTSACTPASQFKTVCPLPTTMPAWGEFEVSLQEVGTGLRLSDDHSFVVILVLPVPTIQKVVPVRTVINAGDRLEWELKVHFDWGTAAGTPELIKFSQDYLSQVECRIGAVTQAKNVTWGSNSYLSCWFQSAVHLQDDQCVSVSFNGGRTFTTDCPAKEATTRAPVQLSYAPTFSLMYDSTMITISGVGFSTDIRYWCVFLGPDLVETLVEATIVSSTSITCMKPLKPSTNETHLLEITLVMSPDWSTDQVSPPLVVKVFETKHSNYAYADLIQVTPDRADSLGGTSLVIEALNNPLVVKATGLMCRFSSVKLGDSGGNQVDIAASPIDETHFGCVTPDFSASFSASWTTSSVQEVYLSVSELDGTFRKRSQLRFRYFSRPEVKELWPDEGFATSLTQILLHGANFVNFADIKVRALGTNDQVEFSWSSSEVLFLDSENIRVEMPATNAPERRGRANQVRFEVSLNGGAAWTTNPTSSPLYYKFLDVPIVIDISHKWSNLRGGFDLTIEILHLRYDSTCTQPINDCGAPADIAYCIIGEAQNTLTHLNATHATCEVPAQEKERMAPVALKTKGGLVFGTNNPPEKAYLEYTSESGVKTISPTEGSHKGGQEVTLTGNFTAVGDEEVLIKFGNIAVESISERSDTHYVVTPQALDLEDGEDRRRVNVTITWVRTQLVFQNATVTYTFKNYSEVASIWPEAGPSSGNTLIEVRGEDFDQEPFCKLSKGTDIIEIRPLWVSPDLVLCETVARTAGVYKFEMVFGSGAHAVDQNLNFTFYDDPHILALTTSHVSLQAHSRGVRIGAWGYGFLDTTELAVRIGEWVQPATFVNSTFIIFNPPEVLEPGAFTIDVTNNGMDFSFAASNITLTFHADFSVSSLSISRVQIEEGGTVNITVQGIGLPKKDSGVLFYCVLAPVGANPFTDVVLQAELTSSDGTEVLCPNAPAKFTSDHITEGESFTVSVRFSFDQQELAWRQDLLYFPPPVLTSVSPTQVLRSQSEMVLTTEGTGILDAGSDIVCTVTPVDDDSTSLKASLVVVQSSTLLQCQFAMPPKGKYILGLSINGLQFVNMTSSPIEVLPTVQIYDVDPASVTTRTEGQVILVRADNLFDDCRCHFEHLSPALAPFEASNDDTLGTRLGEHLLACPIPKVQGMGEGFLKLQVSLNGEVRTKSQSFALIRITDRCFKGFYCTNGEVVQCPPGHECPGGVLDQPPRRCPIGEYQDKPGAGSCRPCSKGYICPFPAMERPMPCPPGFMCGEEGLHSPTEECIEGHYCLAGTQGRDPFLNGLLTRQADKCKRGSYCKPGMKTGVVLITTNSSSPAPCPQGMVCSEGSAEHEGVGPCPAGHFCPTPRHSGIPCPPRHYCARRGNVVPQRCPRGTFNMHYGQQNCTMCPLGHICPVEGLFLPLTCPPGYACNQEHLIFPENLCKIGHICLGGVMSGTLSANRSCGILQIIGGYDQCTTRIGYSVKQFEEYSAQALPAYFFERTDWGAGKSDACCWTRQEVAAWFEQIGASIGWEDAFRSYTDSVNTTLTWGNRTDLSARSPLTDEPFLWDGMRIVDKAIFGHWLDKTDFLDIPLKRHRELIGLYSRVMYTSHQAQLCPGGYLCLDGVNTDQLKSSVNSPYPCPSGSYCLPGSDSVIGTDLCEKGYYCPEQTTYPYPSRPGYFTSNPGAPDPQPCASNTFQLQWKQESCDPCPSGYSCKEKGTSTPIICPVGEYRAVTGGALCQPCTKGTFSFERGAKDKLDCQECPPGRICEIEGAYNVSTSSPCTDGNVCKSGSGAKAQTLCPEGYYCPPETSDLEKFNQRCEAGFYCRSGTGEGTKTRDNCPPSYYCPPGTGQYDYQAAKNYTNWREDAPTRCPQGTGLDEGDTKTSLLQCTINTDYRLLVQLDMDIRFEDEGIVVTKRRLSSTPSRRELALVIASKSDPRLKDLYELDYEISEAEDKPDKESDIRDYINLNRHYVSRWSPLKLDLVSKYIEIEALDEQLLDTDSPGAVFDLPPSSYALITMDLRHIPDLSMNWTYGEDWSISFTVTPDLELGDLSKPIQMPEQFLSRDTSKSQILEFTVMAWRHLRMRVDVLCHNALYVNYRHLFFNSTSVEIRRPNRAYYYTPKTFVASIVEAFEITLPINQPKLLNDISDKETAMPAQIVSFSTNAPGEWAPSTIRHQSTNNRNVWVPTSLYWNSRSSINLPYLPFFSNCRGYGSFIPFWSLMEQHFACTLVPYEETESMGTFSFGQYPTADTCEEAVTECIFDEMFGGQQPLPRWFEAGGEASIFQVSVDPVYYYDLMTKEFGDIEVLPVAPDSDGGEGDVQPKEVTLELSYYQVDRSQKRLIAAGMDFPTKVNLDGDEMSGKKQVGYTLSFNFVALSHLELTIAFAFGWHFYLVLYIIVGILALINMAAFAAYHRLAARPKKEGQPVPGFKFFSFLALTIPPALSGSGLALLPVTIMNLLIGAYITGRVFSIDTSVFDCKEPEGDAACPITLLDIIPDDPATVSINYQTLRNGRCGTAFLIMGVYLMQAGMKILIPDKTDESKPSEAHDGNTWEFFTWKRSNMIFVSTFLLFLMVAIIQFSFSDLFGAQIWFSIGCLKVMALIVDNKLEESMDEAFLSGPLSMCVIVILGLVTFGADDFMDFLNAFFIELGIMMFERTYLSAIVDTIMEQWQQSIPKAFNAISALFANDDEAPEDDLPPEILEQIRAQQAAAGGEATEDKKKTEDGDGSEESSNSEVFYSEEESGAAFNDEELNDDDPDIVLNNPVGDSGSGGSGSGEMSGRLQRMEDADVDRADMERRRKERYRDDGSSEIGDKEGADEEGDGLNQSAEDEASSESAKKANTDDEEEDQEEGADEVDVDLDEDAEAEEVEPLISEYAGYANDTLALFYTPLFVGLLWMFYEETVVANQYGIKVQDFVYYFLWSIVIAPPQVIIDIIFLNIVEWYHRLPIHDYLDYMAHRFDTRKARWKGNEPFSNVQVEASLRALDQMCFSSQHFFVQTLFVSGITQVVLGIQTLLWTPGYNLFSDLGTGPVTLSTYAMCIMLEKICVAGGTWFDIWKIDESTERLEGQEESVDLGDLFKKLNTPVGRAFISQGQTPNKVKFHASQWRVVEQARTDQDEQMNELASDRVITETFRNVFLTYNKPWLQGQLHEVFTPRTLFVHRKEIIEQFAKVMDEIQPEVSISEASSEKESEKSAGGQAGGGPQDVVRVAAAQANMGQSNIKPATGRIAHYWLVRCRFIATLRVQTQSIVDLNLQDECLYCGAMFGLQVELMQNIEDFFREFLRKSGEKMPKYNFQKWIRYFKENALFRTTCAECAEMINDYHHKLRRKTRFDEVRKTQKQEEETLTKTMSLATPMTTTLGRGAGLTQQLNLPFSLPKKDEAEDKREKIRQMGERFRQLAQYWVGIARASLAQKNP